MFIYIFNGYNNYIYVYTYSIYNEEHKKTFYVDGHEKATIDYRNKITDMQIHLMLRQYMWFSMKEDDMLHENIEQLKKDEQIGMAFIHCSIFSCNISSSFTENHMYCRWIKIICMSAICLR